MDLLLVADPDSGILDAVAWGHNETYYNIQLVHMRKYITDYYLIIRENACIRVHTHNDTIASMQPDLLTTSKVIHYSSTRHNTTVKCKLAVGSSDKYSLLVACDQMLIGL